MPTSTGIVTTSAGYPANQESGAAIVGPFQTLATVQFTVTGASVVAQVAKMQKNSRALYWDQLETVFPPGQSGFTGVVHGIRFRSVDPDSPATVVINGYFADDPIPFTNPQPVDYTLNPDGTIVPIGGSGIQFDTDNQGDTLQVTTNAFGGMAFDANDGTIVIETNTAGFDLTLNSAANLTQNAVGGLYESAALINLSSSGDMNLSAVGRIGLGDGTSDVEMVGPGGVIYASNTPGVGLGMTSSSDGIVLDGSGGLLDIQTHQVGGVNTVRVQPAAPTAKIAFFDGAGIAQPAAPVTLADLKTLWRAYGLTAA